MITRIVDAVQDKIKGKPGGLRSPEWNKVRKQHLQDNPTCAACGGGKKLQVHHVKPFHLHPELELDPTNLITLCEDGGLNCHLTFGHLGDFKSFNIEVVQDTKIWYDKISKRPMNDANQQEEN